MKQMVADHAKINDDMKTRVQASDKRYEDLINQYHKHDEDLNAKHKAELAEGRESLNKYFSEEIRKYSEQINEIKEKGKRKQGELQMQINDVIQKNSFENGQMKSTFEELMNNMQSELESKRDLS